MAKNSSRMTTKSIAPVELKIPKIARTKTVMDNVSSKEPA
jgi:hypothetical protein